MNQRLPLLSRLAGATCSLMLGGLFLVSAAHADVGAAIGGSSAAGDQASLQLDASIAGAFTYKAEGSTGFAADAHFDRHLFCIDVASPTSSQTRLYPHYQLPVSSGGDDVWNFPDVRVGSLTYAGAHLRISEGNAQLRCLTAMPSLDPYLSWNVSHGLFDSGMGDYSSTARLDPNPPGPPPAVPHQNIKLAVKKLNVEGMYVVRVELQPGDQAIAGGVWRLIDGYNTATLLTGGAGAHGGLMASAVDEADWCELDSQLDFDNLSPATLPPCISVVETDRFVSEDILLNDTHDHAHFLVKRHVSTTPVTGARQGFAVLRVSGGLSGPNVTDEAQDWYPNDSVWYGY